MEDSPMPRLYREVPVNAISEGSGNVQRLDIVRAIHRSPQTLDAYFAEVESSTGESRALDAHVAAPKETRATFRTSNSARETSATGSRWA